MKYFTNSKLIFIFLIFLIISLTQGLACKYLELNFCKYGFFVNFWEENGLIENMQSLFLVTAIFFLYKARSNFKHIKIINYFITIQFLALIYFLGEEISWGQHFFNWASPEFFENINNQQETNLHNISNLFDQLPRTVVLIWCGLISFCVVFAKRFMYLDKKILFILCPNINLIYISSIILFFVLPDLIVDKFNFHPGHVDQFGKEITNNIFYDIVSFNFVRLSELHELLFTFYFANYAYFINRKSI